ncbi:MAG: SRPBCC family protein [Actinobacteria bacterium]|nr:MAG: SRPBCC family protein [Actinomycetota bacterium]
MPSFHHTIDIAATAQQVWAVLGDLTSVDRWIPGVTSVTRTGTGRTCTFDDGHVQQEQILDYSPTTHSYRYVIDGAPLPVRDNTGTFAVEDTDNGSRVVWESSFVPLDPAGADELARMWEPYLPVVLASLKKVVEDDAAR